jgi:hypothetical protein
LQQTSHDRRRRLTVLGEPLADRDRLDRLTGTPQNIR